MIILLWMVLLLAGTAAFVAFPLLAGEGSAPAQRTSPSPPGLTGVVRDRGRQE